jgi:MFS family permease
MLLLGWSILEGVGAALMTPATASIITGTYTGKNRAFAMGIWTAVASVGAAIGPLFGGFLTTFLSWRWGFGIELIIVMIILIFSRHLRSFPPSMQLEELDKTSIVLSTMGILVFVIGILTLNTAGGWKTAGIMIGMGIVFLALFYYREKTLIMRGLKPLTDIRLFRNWNFTLGNFTRLIMQLALAGTVFVLPVFLQEVTGLDAFTTGLASLPITMGLFVFAIASSRITSRIAPHRVVSLGFLLSLLGSFILSFQFNLNTTVWDLVPGSLILGVGLGLAFPVTTNIVLSSADDTKQSDASGILSTCSSLGSSMGTAIIGLVLILGVINGLYAAVDQTFPNEFTKDDIKQNLTHYTETFKHTNLTGLRENEKTNAFKIVNITIINEMKTTFDFISLIFLIGLISSLFIKPLKQK